MDAIAQDTARRIEQLERDRARLLERMERELTMDVTPLPEGHRVTPLTISRLTRPPRPVT